MRPLLLLALLAAASPFSLAASVTLRGRATGAGALAGCKVTLTGPATATAVTDADGAFELNTSAFSPASLAGGLLRLDAASTGCADVGTGLAPPISMGALVPKYDKADPKPYAALNGVTTLAYYTKKNVAKPQVSPYASLFGGAGFDAATFYGAFGPTLGINGASKAGVTDLLASAAEGDVDASKGQALSAEILTSLAVGGQGLAGLKAGVSPDAAAEAMVVATFPAGAAIVKKGDKFDLSTPDSLAAIFNKALGGAPQDVVTAVTDALAATNGEIAAASPRSVGAAGARALKFGQTTLGPAARKVAAKDTEVAAFKEEYGGEGAIAKAVQATTVESGSGDDGPRVQAAASEGRRLLRK